MIETLLAKLGFGEKEIKIYLTILQNGKITPANISLLTKINRTTVYSITKELLERGVIKEDLGSEQRYLLAVPPQEWDVLIKKEEKKLVEKKNLMEETIKELGKFAEHTKYAVPKIVFVAEEDIENHLYKQTPVWNKSILQYDKVWWGFQDASLVRYFETWIDWYWQSECSEKIEVKLVSNESAENLKKKKFSKRHIKFWKEGKDFTATTWISGDYVIMVVTSVRPHYLVEIYDTVLAHNLREVFKGVWKNV